MDDQLDIRTFGGLTIYRNGTLIDDFDQRKVPALLVYLACAQRPQPREVLAELFWAGRTQSQSLANLRVVLSDLRKTVGPFVDIARDTIAMAGNGTWRLDVAEFEAQLARGDNDPACLESALKYYQGNFLHGFYIDSRGFEDWVWFERERMRFQAIEALDRLIAHALAGRDFSSGLAQATRLLQLDSLREKTYRHLMQLSALSDERTAALNHYRACCKMLATELGTQPAAETVDLYEHIRAGKLLPPTVADAPSIESPHEPRPRHNLPVQPTSFIGRETEIRAIIDQLNNPDCRLLSLVGAGGIGKTRLALAVAEQQVNSFAHGVFFVPLAPVTTPDGIVSAIAMALGFQFYQSQDSAEKQLLNFLAERELLLVLDNFEHLLAGVEIVSTILTETPGVAVLATSREPLNVVWEWLYEVRGLLHPDNAETGQFEDYSAIRLFVERARRVKPGFRLVDERAHIIHICQRVGGMPLGIEIAAAWVRMMPCEAIARELLGLETPRRDVPARHQSLRTLFDYTMQRLSSTEQEIFTGLSVFKGGFTDSAAEVVTGASFTQLVTLVNKSVLRRDYNTNRYSMHELLRQYAFDQLNKAGKVQQYRTQHARHYLTRLARLEAGLRGDNFPQALDDLRADFENIRVAWQHATEHVDTQVLGNAAETLRLFASMTGQWLDSAGMFEQAANALEAKPHRDEAEDIVLVRLLARAGWCYAFGNQEDHRRALQQRGHALIHRLGQRPNMPFAIWYLWAPEHGFDNHVMLQKLFTEFQDHWGIGASLLEQAHLIKVGGDPARAALYYAQSLAVLEAYGDHAFAIWPRLYLYSTLSVQGKRAEAQPFVEKCLEVADQLKSRWLRGYILDEMIRDALWHDDVAEAERLSTECYTLGREIGSKMVMLFGVLGFAFMYLRNQDYAGALRALEEGLLLDEDRGFRATLAWQLGIAYAGLGQLPAARAYLIEALQRGLAFSAERPERSIPMIADILPAVAYLWSAEGEYDNALKCMAASALHMPMGKYVHVEARVRAALEAELGTDAVEAAIERGKDLDPLELAREVLVELETR